MSRPKKDMMTEDILSRPGEETPPAPAPVAPDPPAPAPAVEETPPALELEQLKAQNEALMKMVMEMRSKLMPDETEKKAKLAAQFDKLKLFRKHRSLEHGVWYEQNGRKYNGKFELMAEA